MLRAANWERTATGWRRKRLFSEEQYGESTMEWLRLVRENADLTTRLAAAEGENAMLREAASVYYEAVTDYLDALTRVGEMTNKSARKTEAEWQWVMERGMALLMLMADRDAALAAQRHAGAAPERVSDPLADREA